MGELIMSAPVAGLTSKNKITAEDVAMLRREVFADGVVNRGEAETLFALDHTARDKCGEEARNRVAEALARRAETIDADEAKWLAERIGGGQRPLRDNERAMLTLIRHASPEIHSALKPLLDKVA